MILKKITLITLEEIYILGLIRYKFDDQLKGQFQFANDEECLWEIKLQ